MPVVTFGSGLTLRRAMVAAVVIVVSLSFVARANAQTRHARLSTDVVEHLAAGSPSIVWEIGGESIVWDTGDETVWGTAGDIIIWRTGDDTTFWGSDGDTIVWGTGGDIIVWRTGNDTIFW